MYMFLGMPVPWHARGVICQQRRAREDPHDIMKTEEVVGLVLGALHPRLRERCSEAKILSVLEDDCGAYDVETPPLWLSLCVAVKILRACGARQC